MATTHHANEPTQDASHAKHAMKAYGRFAAMIVTSTAIMFGLMYLNTYSWEHATWSETRFYMALIMGATMAVVMLSFMLKMYPNGWVNGGIYLGGVLLFALALWLVRSQTTVDDLSYMRAMIPHHSIAIMTSERARISDPRVRKLADGIIAAQRREIAEMKSLIQDIQARGPQVPGGGGGGSAGAVPAVQVQPPDAAAAEVPKGFRAEVVMSGLTYPTSVEFDDAGTMYIAEAGYSYGDPSVKPRLLRVSQNGDVAVVAQGDPLVGPVNDLLWHDGRLYVSHRGKISVLEEGGRLRDLVTGLPSDGDHHNNQMTAGRDGKIYFGQGTATNSGVVGVDNYKMGWLKDHPEFHDVPARDVKLVGRTYETPNPMASGEQKVQTSGFHPFGQANAQGAVVTGQTKSSGTILSMNPDGSGLQVYAWGLRNPYGVMWSPDGTLYATENGFDVRGSRPIANDEEDIYVIKQGAWYGWPDYAMGLPVTSERFKAEGEPDPQFLMAEHPPVERPWLNFPKHSAITKLDFAKSDAFGKGKMFVAFFGHMSPMTGKAPEQHGGHRVVRIDPANRNVEEFFSQKKGHGGGHSHGGSSEGQQDESVSPGPRRLMDVRFAPDGQALYIADFGSMVVKEKPQPIPGTGVIWRVVPEMAKPSDPPTGLSAPR